MSDVSAGPTDARQARIEAAARAIHDDYVNEPGGVIWHAAEIYGPCPVCIARVKAVLDAADAVSEPTPQDARCSVQSFIDERLSHMCCLERGHDGPHLCAECTFTWPEHLLGGEKNG